MDNKEFPTLYKIDQNGNTRIWRISFDEEESTMIIEHGFKSGNIIPDVRKVLTNKSGRNVREQAFVEMKNRYTKALRNGYVTSLENVSTNIPLQLANKYKNDNGKSNIVGFPVICQPKLDGIRAYVHTQCDEILIKSRKHIPFPWLDHLKSELKHILSNINNSNNIALDGELYIHEESFETLSSIIRTRKTKHKFNDKIKYNIFDLIVKDISSEQRYKILEDAISKNETKFVNLVPSKLIYSHQELDDYHTECVRNGYEGVMIRHILSSIKNKRYNSLSTYKGKRNNALLKYKTFSEEEGTIIDIVEGTGREKGAAVFIVKDPRGNVLNMRPMGTIKQRKNMFNEKDDYIGKDITYSFQKLSDKNVPIFAVAKQIRDYEN